MLLCRSNSSATDLDLGFLDCDSIKFNGNTLLSLGLLHWLAGHRLSLEDGQMH